MGGDAADTPLRSLDTHMSRRRSKLKFTGANDYTITAEYGVGYRLDAVPLQPPHGAGAHSTERVTERSDLLPQMETS